jgi:hypothetical protein
MGLPDGAACKPSATSCIGTSSFDARNNEPRIGRVLIARGRDAADVALNTTFGPNKLESFAVQAEESVVA